jgi:predicted Rossmann-fold nucleotide-binding protein
MGEARNAIIVWSADAVIAIGGSWGTPSVPLGLYGS